jgi:hypothetical protein
VKAKIVAGRSRGGKRHAEVEPELRGAHCFARLREAHRFG